MFATAHLDTFVRDRLPPREQWPVFYFDLPELRYPERVNCASELLDQVDASAMDDQGYLWHQARTDDMIVSAGYNIAGPEIEAVLLEHPAVAECAVIGVPDADRGQVVKAVVVLRNLPHSTAGLTEALQTFVKARIAPYKYPRVIEFARDLPRTATGKLQGFKLRESG
jgi:2-aminobenzoate-CoA ligase